MAVAIDTIPTNPLHAPKTRLLRRSLQRHASAPARPIPTTLDSPKPRPGQQQISKHKQRSAPLRRSSASPLQPTPTPVNDLAVAQCVSARLRAERDAWRTTARVREQRIAHHERDLACQQREFAALRERHVALDLQRTEMERANDNLVSLLGEAVTRHDEMASELDDSKRAAARLKKSDRAKGKVLQRNLRLKSLLGRGGVQAGSGPAAADANTEAVLLEALAAATERIEELESKGEVLLEALEARSDGCGSDEEGDGGTAELLEAEVAFRGVLDDESIGEQKRHWESLLME